MQIVPVDKPPLTDHEAKMQDEQKLHRETLEKNQALYEKKQQRINTHASQLGAASVLGNPAQQQ